MTITKEGTLASFYTVNKAPIKHLKVYFSPKQAGEGTPSPENVRPIEGWDSVDLYHTGKNLFNPNATYKTNAAYRSYQFIHQDEVCTASFVSKSGLNHTSFGFSLYDASITGAANKGYAWTLDKSSGILTNTKNKVTYPPDTRNQICKYVMINPSNDDSYAALLNDYDIQIELGEVSTEYEPYRGQTHTLDWTNDIGTVYGGYVDLVTGELVQTHNRLILDGSEQGWISANSNRIFYIEIPEMKSGVWYTDNSSLCNYAKKVNSSTDRYFECLIGYNNNKRIYFYNAKTVIQDVSNLESFKAWLSTHNVIVTYPIDIPITHQLSPTQLSTLIGRNNIWSNADRVEVEYDLAESNDELYRRRNILLRSAPYHSPLSSQH